MVDESDGTETSSLPASRQRFLRQELSIGRVGLSKQSRRGRCDIRIRKSPQDELPPRISATLRRSNGPITQPCEGSPPTFRPIIRISSRALLFCTTPGRIR